MDTLVVKRNLANQKNTAQYNVDQSIKRASLSARKTEYVLPMMPLHGQVNLRALNTLNVESVVAKEQGYITEVYGMPDALVNFQMDRQLLIEIPNLPKSLEKLSLNHNFVEKIDLSKLTRLKVLSLNGNRLKSLGELPASIEEIYVDGNRISRINLEGLDRLRILHCRNNRVLRIENIPASMVDLKVEEGNPFVVLDYAFVPGSAVSEDDRRARGTEAEYADSLHEYFRLKSKYEDAAKIARSIARERALNRGLSRRDAIKRALAIRPKCVNCKRPVGSVFKIKDDRFLAYCGDHEAPCGLRIEIFKGRFESDDQFAIYSEKQWLETKERIIQQKMNVLFDYASEEETVQKFKDLIEEYNLYSFLRKTDLDAREDKRFNVHKRELIKGKIALLEELKVAMNAHLDDYKETGNRDSLHSAIDTYIKEYLPETHNLRMMKYSVTEMAVPAGLFEDSTVRVLNQRTASIKELETLHGEVPKVLKFSVGQAPVEHREEDIDDDEGLDSLNRAFDEAFESDDESH